MAPPPYHLLVDWCGGVLVDFLGICWCPCHLFLFFFSLFFLVDRKARYTFFDPSSRPLPIPLGSHPLEVISFLFLIVSCPILSSILWRFVRLAWMYLIIMLFDKVFFLHQRRYHTLLRADARARVLGGFAYSALE